MLRTRSTLPFVLLAVLVVRLAPTGASDEPTDPQMPMGRIWYVRQTVGDDSHDGSSPGKAWRSLARLARGLRAGDTAYVGPGLYREQLHVRVDGTAAEPIALVADPTGEHTGDPPGTVMITGSDPVDETLFTEGPSKGVYHAAFPDPVIGVVEMDGPQYRYRRTSTTKEHLVEHLSEVEVVSKMASSYAYDEQAKILHIHTSDGRHPRTHELELAHRTDGIVVTGKNYLTIVGFTIRHTGDAGIRFFSGSGNGVAIRNTSYGNRQGIRVYEAKNVLVQGNTLFRNENCGVYFAKESIGGQAVANVLYENVKGARWSSGSAQGLAAANVAFDNLEAGISVESTEDVRVVGNRLVDNRQAQLLFLDSRPQTDGNCLETRAPGQLVADLSLEDRYPTLESYQRAAHRDMGSRQAGCGALPERVDVRKLHEETTRYTERARKAIAAQAPPQRSAPSPQSFRPTTR